MGNIYGLLDIDADKKEKGVPVSIGDGITIRVAQFNNPNFTDYWKVITGPHRMSIDKGTIDDATMQELLIDALAHTILVGWKGIEVDGKAFPYSKKNAMKLLTELEEFRNIVADESRKFANFRKGAQEIDEKNSARS